MRSGPYDLDRTRSVTLSYTIATWTPGDVATAAKLVTTLQTVFGHPSHDLAWFLWKHERNPLGPSIVTYAVDDTDGTVAAVRALWRWPLDCSGVVLPAFQPCDTATHPGHRRQGLFTALTRRAIGEASAQGAKLLFNYPNGSSAPGYTKLGWDIVGPLALLARPVRVVRSLSRRLLSRDRGVHFRSDRGACAGQLSEDLVAYTKLIRHSGPGVYGPRTLCFLGWRLAAHPQFTYAVSIASECGIVYRTGWRGGLREVSVEDLTGVMSPRTLGAVIRSVARDADADIVTALLPAQHPQVGTLMRLGFLRIPSRGRIMARALATQDPAPFAAAPCGLTGCDIDTH